MRTLVTEMVREAEALREEIRSVDPAWNGELPGPMAHRDNVNALREYLTAVRRHVAARAALARANQGEEP